MPTRRSPPSLALLLCCANVTLGCGARSELSSLLDASTDAGPPAVTANDAGAPSPTDVVELSLSEFASCALRRDGTVWCWGGLDPTHGWDTWAMPTRVAGVTEARHLSCSGNGQCGAVLADGRVYVWGSPDHRAFLPGFVPDVGDATGMFDGWSRWCIRRANDEFLCGNPFGPSLIPIPGTRGAIGMSNGHPGLCFLASDGSVSCTDDSGAYDGPFPPSPMPNLRGAVQLAAGDDHTCARLQDGTRQCWGGNYHNQFGPVNSHWGQTEPRDLGVIEPAIEGGLELLFGGDTSCQRTSSGDFYCWGGRGGEIIDGEMRPKKVAGLPPVDTAAVGRNHSCAASGERVWCWGANGLGELGDGTTEDREEPVLVRW